MRSTGFRLIRRKSSYTAIRSPMKPHISEFSYGYAITDELIHGLGTGVTAAPVFPSLYQEGQIGGGYDVMIQGPAIPLFIQFKLSHCMTTRNASEYKDGLLDVPFYRMHLRPSRISDQHSLLITLEAQGNEVYYCAPCFHQDQELNAAYLSQTVCSKSIWITPFEIGALPDADDHHASFQNTSDGYFHFCSVPQKRRCNGSFSALINKLIQKLKSERSGKQMDGLAQQLLSLAKRHGITDSMLPVNINSFADYGPLERAAVLSQTLFGSQLYIVRPAKTA